MPSVGIHLLVLDETLHSLKKANGKAADYAAHIENFPAFATLGAVGPDLLYYIGFSKEVVAAVVDIYEKVNHTISPILERFASLAKDAGMPNSADRLAQLAHATELDFKTIEAVLTSAIVVLNNSVNSTILTPSKIEEDKPEPEWAWGDLLHWRGNHFADRLFHSAERQGLSPLIAYACGYKTHVVADALGHPYVNQVVGGPSRAFPMRHHLAESFMDAYAYWTRGRDINTASVHKRMLPSLSDGALIPFLRSELRSLVDASTPPNKLPEPPTEGDLLQAFVSMLELMRYVTAENFVPPPQPPKIQIPPLPFQYGSITQRLGQAVPDLSNRSTLADILKALIILILMVPAFMIDLAKFAADIAVGLSTYPAAALIYIGHVFIYWVYRQIRWFLVLTGIAFPLQDELGSSLGRQFLPCRQPSNEDYPRRLPHVKSWKDRFSYGGQYIIIDSNDFDYLHYPTTPKEYPELVASPYGSDATPNTFINGLLADPNYIAAWDNIGNPYDLGNLNRTILFPVHGTGKSGGLGNAVELSTLYICGDISLARINLDADRGYGYLNWTCLGGISQGMVRNERFL